MSNNTYYIVRTESAGVFFGKVKDLEGHEITMTDTRRLWYWEGATECIGLATSGVTRPEKCKFTVTVPEITILGVIEVIPCSEQAERSIKGVPAWTV